MSTEERFGVSFVVLAEIASPGEASLRGAVFVGASPAFTVRERNAEIVKIGWIGGH